ncbi:MAG: ABC transporter substrate-binding protein [Chloroflexota bacterium]
MGVDEESQTIQPGLPDAFAEDWEVSEDNLVYTLTLREDYTWSDGTAMTANDVLYNWELMNDEAVGHPDAFVLDEIASVEVIDDFTIVFTMNSPACSALNFIGGVPPVPAHIYANYSAEELSSAEELNTQPSVTSGPFIFGRYAAGEIVSLIADPEYVDAPEEGVQLLGFIQKVLTDQPVILEELISPSPETVNFFEGVPATQQDRIREAEGMQVFEYPGNSWDYMGFNLADADNPQPALDENGERVDQGINKYFTDKMVRHAIGHAVDVDDIIEGALFGNGTRMAAQLTPSSWAHDSELAPRSFDQELAAELLDEAGWVLNEDGIRVCEDCLYAVEVDESFNGEPFEFTLFTNAGNERREAIGTIIQDQLADLGITVDFQTIEFNTLLDIMDAQTFDAFILGWRAGYPDDPNTIQLFGAEADVPASGFNFTSFYNEEYFELEEAANSVAGCDQEERAAIYAEMQSIMYDEMPYLWLFSQNGMYAANDNVNGFAPFPNNIDWNLTQWSVAVE